MTLNLIIPYWVYGSNENDPQVNNYNHESEVLPYETGKDENDGGDSNPLSEDVLAEISSRSRATSITTEGSMSKASQK